jgi:hypothetical protein
MYQDWKIKKQVDQQLCPPRMQSSQERIFEPASNVERKKEEGCMPKIKIERTAKLAREDRRGKTFNILTGASIDNKVWLNAMGSQAQGFTL